MNKKNKENIQGHDFCQNNCNPRYHIHKWAEIIASIVKNEPWANANFSLPSQIVDISLAFIFSTDRQQASEWASK